MSLWMVRAGKKGEQEGVALEKSIITIGWNELHNLSFVKTKAKWEKVYWETYPEAHKMRAANEIGQIWNFIHDLKIGDLIGLPLKTQPSIAIGKVEGDYEYKPIAENVKHIRRVKWIKNIPRSAFDQDLLNSFNAFRTVCQIKRNNAEEKVKRLL